MDDLIRQQIAAIPGVRTTRSHMATSTIKETARIPIDDLDVS
jgi:hypothetical protein